MGEPSYKLVMANGAMDTSDEMGRALFRIGWPSRQAANAAALLMLGAALAACKPVNTDGAEPAASGTIAGTVIYRERIALPADATIEVRLENVSRADAPSTVVAQQTIGAAGRQVPIPFELTYGTGRIEPNNRYGLRAEIRAANGELMFATTSHHGVFDQEGAPRDIELVVQRVTPGVTGSPTAAVSDSTGSITGGGWQLVSIARPGQAVERVGSEPSYTIEFGADGRYTGQAHCNRFTGGYERAETDRITIRGGAATLAACPEPSIAAEFLSALAGVTRYVVRGDTLELAANGGSTLTFTRRSQGTAGDEADRREAPWADAKRRGATFRAVGNEPAWSLEIHADRLVVVTNLGADRTELAHGGPAVDGAQTTYRAAGDDREITAVIERRSCADTMSGEAFEASATVTFAGETFRGCGRFL